MSKHDTDLHGVRVVVSLAPGWKCIRCRKVLPEVGLCEEHPELCMRCVAVVEPEIEIDIHAWAARRFDVFLAEYRAQGMDLREAVIHAGKRNRGEYENKRSDDQV